MKLKDHLIVADRCRGTPAEKSIRELVGRLIFMRKHFVKRDKHDENLSDDAVLLDKLIEVQELVDFAIKEHMTILSDRNLSMMAEIVSGETAELYQAIGEKLGED